MTIYKYVRINAKELKTATSIYLLLAIMILSVCKKHGSSSMIFSWHPGLMTNTYPYNEYSHIDNESILQGRPHGGVITLHKKELASRLEQLIIGNCTICALKVSVNANYKMLVMCIYMPCDTHHINQANTEYEHAINCVVTLIQY